MHAITVRHNFETAHRLYNAGPSSKCWNLHGHSFWTEITVGAVHLDTRGMVVEYGEFKHAIRSYIDDRMDHGAVLNDADPLSLALLSNGCKVLLLTDHDPTVEALADHLAEVAEDCLSRCAYVPGARVTRVRVQETHVNAAEWSWTQP